MAVVVSGSSRQARPMAKESPPRRRRGNLDRLAKTVEEDPGNGARKAGKEFRRYVKGLGPVEVKRAGFMAALECEIDAGGRFTLWRSRESHGPCHPSAGKATPCGSAIRPPVAERAVRAGSGATPLAEGSVRRSGECVFTPSPPPPGLLPNQDPLQEGHARRHERDGLTGAATSDSEPGHPMGTADPRRHRRPRRVRRPPGRHPAIREPLRERGPVRGRRGGAPRRPRRGHMECGPREYAACKAERRMPRRGSAARPGDTLDFKLHVVIAQRAGQRSGNARLVARKVRLRRKL